MKRLSLVIVAAICSVALAKKKTMKEREAEHRRGSGEYVYIHKKGVNKKKVKEKFPHAQVVNTADRMHAKRHSVLALQTQREFFVRSGLAPYVKGFDSFSKDLLVLRIQGNPVSRLQKFYKKIPRATLVNAKRRLPSYLQRDAKVGL